MSDETTTTDAEEALVDPDEAPASKVPGTVVGLIHRMADARVEWEAARDRADKLRRDYEALEGKVFDVFEGAGMRSVRTERGLFRLNDIAWAQVVDPDAARNWAEAQMPELLLLNAARLSKLVRDAIKGEIVIEGGALNDLAGVDLPTGVDFRTSRKIAWTRS